MSLLERLVIFLLYPLVGGLADISVDYALYTLAALCAAFAVGTRLTDQHLPEGVAPAAPEQMATFS